MTGKCSPYTVLNGTKWHSHTVYAIHCILPVTTNLFKTNRDRINKFMFWLIIDRSVKYYRRAINSDTFRSPEIYSRASTFYWAVNEGRTRSDVDGRALTHQWFYAARSRDVRIGVWVRPYDAWAVLIHIVCMPPRSSPVKPLNSGTAHRFFVLLSGRRGLIPCACRAVTKKRKKAKTLTVILTLTQTVMLTLTLTNSFSFSFYTHTAQ